MTDDNTSDSSGSGSLRRDVLKAVGAGGALAVLGGAVSGSQPQVDDDAENGDDAAGGSDDAPGDNRVHVVRTLIRPSTNPDRPADFFYQPTGLQIEPGDVVRFVAETPDHNVVSYHPSYGMQRRVPAGVDAFSSPMLGIDVDSLDELPAEGGEEPPGEEPAGEEPTGEEPTGDEEEVSLGPPETETDTPAEEETPTATESETPAATESEPPAPASATGPESDTWLHLFETPGVYDMECAPHEGFGMAMRVVVGDETDTDFETSDPANLPEPRVGPVGLARVTLTDPALEPEAIVEAGEVMWQDLESVGGGPAPTPDGETPTAEPPTTETPADAVPDNATNGTVTDGNVTNGNVTDGNATSGNATNASDE